MKTSQITISRTWLYARIFISLVALSISGLYGQSNVALRKSARQSSNNYSDAGHARTAVDGNTSGIWQGRNGTITHTRSEQGAWWEVDLGRVYDISQIKIYNRTDCCSERLNNFKITVRKDRLGSSSTFGERIISQVKSRHIINDSKQGRYVRVQLMGKNFLSLAEVQVMGTVARITPPSSQNITQNLFYQGTKLLTYSGPRQQGGDCSLPDWMNDPTTNKFKNHFLAACQKHDHLYNNVPFVEAGVRNGKAIADNLFLMDMHQVCESGKFSGFGEKEYCKTVAETWYTFVAFTQEGKDAYTKGQNNATRNSTMREVNWTSTRNITPIKTLEGAEALLEDGSRWLLGANNTIRTSNTQNNAQYTVTFTTGSENGAGTDANVNLKIYGKKGSTITLDLNPYMGSGFTNAFEINDRDEIKIVTTDVGEITKVVVGHDNKYSGSSWKLENIKIKKGNDTYHFNCQCWINDTRKKTLTRTPPTRNYRVTVQTGTKSGAGTDANVFITIIGSRGRTQEVRLTSYLSGNAFESGDQNTATLSNMPDVGNITGVRIRHDNKYSGAGWFLSWVKVNNRTFHHNGWLEDNNRDKTLR